jgi:hypothetical protein
MSDTLKKSLAMVGVATGFVIGGLGVTQIASAQTSDEAPTVEVPESTEDSDPAETSPDQDRARDRDGERDRRGSGDGDCGEKHEAVAELLGLSVDELRAEREAGNSLAAVAEANGVDPQVLIDTMVADATERINARVDGDNFTQAEADEKLAELPERIEDRVNNTGDHEGQRGHRGPGSAPDADAEAEAEADVEGEGS